MTRTKITLLTMSKTIHHITSSLCTKYDLDLFFNERNSIDCDIVLIDDGANGMSYDKYKTQDNRVLLIVESKKHSLNATDEFIDKVMYKPFLPSTLSDVILEFESEVNMSYQQAREKKIHYNFLVDGTLLHERKKISEKKIDKRKIQEEQSKLSRLQQQKIIEQQNAFRQQQAVINSNKNTLMQQKQKQKQNILMQQQQLKNKNTLMQQEQQLQKQKLFMKQQQLKNKNVLVQQELMAKELQTSFKLAKKSKNKKVNKTLSMHDIIMQEQKLLNKNKKKLSKIKGLKEVESPLKLQNTKIKEIKYSSPINEESDNSAGNIQIELLNKNDSPYDASIIKNKDVSDGGILDSNELLRVKRILKETGGGSKEIAGDLSSLVVRSSDNDEWGNIAKIVDDSIKEYTFEVSEPIRFVLNAYSLQELEPFFEKLDEEAVQALIDGDDVSLDVKMQK